MRQSKRNKYLPAAPLLFIVFILFSYGCGKIENPSAGLNNYVSHNNSMNSEAAGDMINSVTLSWSEPTLNADGTPLSDDLAGYVVYYGPGSDNYTESVDIGNFTSASLSDLPSGTWCFSVISYDTRGNESDFSEEVCKTFI